MLLGRDKGVCGERVSMLAAFPVVCSWSSSRDGSETSKPEPRSWFHSLLDLFQHVGDAALSWWES